MQRNETSNTEAISDEASDDEENFTNPWRAYQDYEEESMVKEERPEPQLHRLAVGTSDSRWSSNLVIANSIFNQNLTTNETSIIVERKKEEEEAFEIEGKKEKKSDKFDQHDEWDNFSNQWIEESKIVESKKKIIKCDKNRVTLRIWEVGSINRAGKRNETGHASLQTYRPHEGVTGYYISYWPKKSCELHLMSEFPSESKLKEYRDSYIFIGKQHSLYYIGIDEECEIVKIDNYLLFLQKLIPLWNAEQVIVLSKEQAKDLITSNGGHKRAEIGLLSPRRPRKLHTFEEDLEEEGDNFKEYNFYSLDVNKITQAFLELKEKNFDWDLYATAFFKAEGTQNCVGVASYLLKEGGVDALIPQPPSVPQALQKMYALPVGFAMGTVGLMYGLSIVLAFVLAAKEVNDLSVESWARITKEGARVTKEGAKFGYQLGETVISGKDIVFWPGDLGRLAAVAVKMEQRCHELIDEDEVSDSNILIEENASDNGKTKGCSIM